MFHEVLRVCSRRDTGLNLLTQQENKMIDELFDRFIFPEPNSGCWIWMGFVNENGYGKVVRPSIRKSPIAAHRYAFEKVKGEIPSGLDLDHLCRVRCCVNPDHLEPVTRSINCLRGETGWAGGNAIKTQCPQGHAYTPENTYTDRTGGRYCIQCKKQAYRRWQLTHREQIRAYKNAWYARRK